MHRRGLTTVALVLVVTLAGCSLLGGDAAPTGSTPTPDGASTTYPAGYGAEGVTDWHRALAGHVGGLSAHDSFILRYNGTVIRGERLATVAVLQVAERPDREAYVVTNVSGQGTVTDYFADGTRYRRFGPPGANNTEYSSEGRSYSMQDFAGGDLVRPLLENVSYSSVERIDSGGETFYRYAGTDYENPASLFGPVDPENVTAFRAAVVVDEEGIVRRLAYQARLDRGDETLFLDVDVEVVGIDATSVDRPDWFERAS